MRSLTNEEYGGRAVVQVHGEFHGTSSTGGELVLYDNDGDVYTLASPERIGVESYQIVVTASGDAGIYFDAGGGGTRTDGESLCRGTYAALGGDSKAMPKTRYFQKGALPRCSCTSGTVDAIIHGIILKS